MNLNKVILVGRLTNDPQLRTTPSGQSVCSFGLATNRVWTDRRSNERKQKPDFHNIVLWRKLAEIASQYLKKGSLTLIEGRLQTRTWEDQNGNRKYRTEIIGERMQLAPKSIYSESQKTPTGQTNSKASEQQSGQQEENIPVIEEDEEINVEEIPF